MADAVSIEATRIGMSMSCRNLGRLAAAALSAVAHNYEVHYHPHRSGVRMSERATDVCGRAHLHVRTCTGAHALIIIGACARLHDGHAIQWQQLAGGVSWGSLTACVNMAFVPVIMAAIYSNIQHQLLKSTGFPRSQRCFRISWCGWNCRKVCQLRNMANPGGP